MPDAAGIPPLPHSKTSRLAIWSLVLGCLGIVLLLVCIGPLFAIPAVICGHLAYSRIRRSDGKLLGKGLAVGGIITGYISITLGIILIPVVLGLGFPRVRQNPQQTPRGSCIDNLRHFDAAKQSWALDKNKTAEDTPTPDDLQPYLRSNFAVMKCPEGGSYSINKVSEPPTCSVPGHRLPTNDRR